ncbi:alpha/beta fold hydrolase [Kribbella sp. NPDC050459]|uniref:alpha/beta hydrolase n=1 Tax=Kribbella sp. NPDC050459 TaxID=3155785 RepID=UPI0033CD42A8
MDLDHGIVASVKLLTPIMVIATLLAACSNTSGGGSTAPTDVPHASVSPTPTQTPTPTPTPTPSTTTEADCGQAAPAGVTVRESMLAATDGVRLNSVSLGSGPRGVVMLHQTDNGICGWFEYGGILAQQGFHVFLFDRRCDGKSTCPGGDKGSRHVADVQTAVAELRRQGARKVAVVGASLGGSVAIGACAAVKVDGCVALSPALFEFPLGDGLTAQKAIGRVGVPLLVADAPDDRSSPLAQVRALLQQARPGVVQFVALPAAAGHGWDTVNDTTDPSRRSQFSTQLTGFLNHILT